VRRDVLGVVAEAPHADHGVVGVGVDVGVGGEVEVDADGAQFERDRAGDVGGQIQIVDLPEEGVARIR
jgi:hypothetical protein